MEKDVYWFRHDCNSGRDLGLRKIHHIYGHEGKGFYWDVVEVLREQPGYKFSFKEVDLQMLAGLISAKDETKFINFLHDCVRFEVFFVEDNFLYSNMLTSYMKVWETKKRNGSENKAKSKLNGGRIEENRREEYNIYLSLLNDGVKKKYRGSESVYTHFCARMAEGRVMADFEQAIKNALVDPYHKENGYKYITPEFLVRADKLDKFSQRSVVVSAKPKTEVETEW